MDWLVGTSGFAYKEWKGTFYPEGLPAGRMLEHYAGQLPAVEINNTFYRLPKRSVLESWADQVPESFRFVIKASRRITHFKRLKNAGDETGYLLETLGVLGDRLGAVLFQLPPNLPLDLERLETFAALLPAGTPAAFEFRHPSWSAEPVDALLRERAWARVRVDDGTDEAGEIDAGAGWVYLRLRGAAYDRGALGSWARRVRAAEPSRAYVFFKHETSGPALAAQLLEVAARGDRRPAAAARRPGRRGRAAG